MTPPLDAPVSLGWISAHAMAEGGLSAAAWRAPLALARAAAAAMDGMAAAVERAGGLSLETRDGDAGAAEFARPFHAASEAAELIRNPLQARPARTKMPRDASEAWSDAFDAGSVGAADVSGVAGAFAALASHGIGDPLHPDSGRPASGLKASAAPTRRRSPDGTWVETGNPTAYKGPSAHPRGRGDHSAHSGGWPHSVDSSHPHSGPQPASVGSKRNRPVMRPTFTAGAGGTALSHSPAPSGFGPWTENVMKKDPGKDLERGLENGMKKAAKRVTEKLARLAAGTASGSGSNAASDSHAPISPKRPPLPAPDDAGTLARFKILLEAHARSARMSGTPPRFGSALDSMFGGVMDGGPARETGQNTHETAAVPAVPAPAAMPFRDARAGGSGPGTMAPFAPPIDASGAISSIPSHSSPRNPAPVPLARPGTAATDEALPTADGRGGSASANGASPHRHGQSQVEWMDEEDDLAAKLHRLLRRQAKRRGVDLP